MACACLMTSHGGMHTPVARAISETLPLLLLLLLFPPILPLLPPSPLYFSAVQAAGIVVEPSNAFTILAPTNFAFADRLNKTFNITPADLLKPESRETLQTVSLLLRQACQDRPVDWHILAHSLVGTRTSSVSVTEMFLLLSHVLLARLGWCCCCPCAVLAPAAACS